MISTSLFPLPSPNPVRSLSNQPPLTSRGSSSSGHGSCHKPPILHQRRLKNSFLVVGSGPHPTEPHRYPPTSSVCSALFKRAAQVPPREQMHHITTGVGRISYHNVRGVTSSSRRGGELAPPPPFCSVGAIKGLNEAGAHWGR